MKRILFVCTGNTCRSPMAQAILTHLLAMHHKTDIQVASAGIAAFPGMSASPQAIRVMAERGLDIGAHRAQLLTPDMVDAADLILCMSQNHAGAVRAMGMGPGDKVNLLAAYAAGMDTAIEDPYGGGIDIYRRCAAQLSGMLAQLVQGL